MNNIDTSWLNWEWIWAEKEWLFSGVGLSVIGILFSALGFAFVLYRMHRQRQQVTNITQNTHDNATGTIHNGQGDININYQSISSEQFRQLSKDLGVTEFALKNFFKIVEKKQVPIEDLDNTLREIARHYKELLVKVNTLNPNNPEVAKLIKKAKQAIEKGEFEQADQLSNQTDEDDLETDINYFLYISDSKLEMLGQQLHFLNGNVNSPIKRYKTLYQVINELNRKNQIGDGKPYIKCECVMKWGIINFGVCDEDMRIAFFLNEERRLLLSGSVHNIIGEAAVSYDYPNGHFGYSGSHLPSILHAIRFSLHRNLFFDSNELEWFIFACRKEFETGYPKMFPIETT